jgi:hypothetical protein
VYGMVATMCASFMHADEVKQTGCGAHVGYGPSYGFASGGCICCVVGSKGAVFGVEVGLVGLLVNGC